jgi:capsule polysaccharide export protein KpsE/RkpR
MKEIHEKLDVWSRLYRQCEQMKARLDCGQSPSDAASIEAEYRALKARTEAAFKDASAAINSVDRAAIGHGMRRPTVQLGG